VEYELTEPDNDSDRARRTPWVGEEKTGKFLMARRQRVVK